MWSQYSDNKDRGLMHRRFIVQLAILTVGIGAFTGDLLAIASTTSKKKNAQAKSRASLVRKVAAVRGTRSSAVRPLAFSHTQPRVVIAGGPWRSPNFADSTEGDRMDGEDPRVRQAAVEALGPINGT